MNLMTRIFKLSVTVKIFAKTDVQPKIRDSAPAGIRTRVVPLEGSSLGVKALNAWPDYTTGA